MGSNRFCNRHTRCVLRHAQMARKLCIQNRIELVDICTGRNSGAGNCAPNGELAKLESGYEEPGGGVAV